MESSHTVSKVAHPGPPRGSNAAAISDQLRAFTTSMDRYVVVRGGAHGMHRTDLHALAHVMDAARAGAQLTPGELATALNLSSPATSALLSRLEAAGHVQRRHEDADRRRVSIAITEQAMRVGASIFLPLAAALDEVIAGFTSAEQATVLRFLAAAVRATSDAAGAPGP